MKTSGDLHEICLVSGLKPSGDIAATWLMFTFTSASVLFQAQTSYLDYLGNLLSFFSHPCFEMLSESLLKIAQIFLWPSSKTSLPPPAFFFLHNKMGTVLSQQSMVWEHDLVPVLNLLPTSHMSVEKVLNLSELLFRQPNAN